MRAFAFLLLGLLALTAARPACATMAAPTTTQEGHGARAHCPETPGHATHHACAMASCVGCALGVARMTLPVGAIALRPIAPVTASALALAGSGPAAAIPPPRPIA